MWLKKIGEDERLKKEDRRLEEGDLRTKNCGDLRMKKQGAWGVEKVAVFSRSKQKRQATGHRLQANNKKTK